jgi:hypothetical protein
LSFAFDRAYIIYIGIKMEKFIWGEESEKMEKSGIKDRFVVIYCIILGMQEFGRRKPSICEK